MSSQEVHTGVPKRRGDPNKKMVGVWIHKAKKTAAEHKAVDIGSSVSKVCRAFLEAWVRGDIEDSQVLFFLSELDRSDQEAKIVRAAQLAK